MRRRQAIRLALGSVSVTGLAFLAGCDARTLPPECNPRMTSQECGQAVAQAAAERAAKQAADEAQRQAEGAVAEGRRRLDEFWSDLWKSAPKPTEKAPVLIPKGGPTASFAIVAQPVPIDRVTWFNWFGATEYAWADHLKDEKNREYEALQGLHSGLDFLVPLETPIVNCVNQTGRVISVSNSPLDYKADPHNVLVKYDEYLVLYGHTSPNRLPAVGSEIRPGERVASSGTNTRPEDGPGTPHLHLEVIPIDDDWRKLPADQQARRKPGNNRINPLPFFSAELQKQLMAVSLKKDRMHYPSEHQWGKPEVQPTITPGGKSFW